MSDTDVLIAGAGPTGLVLALWLSRAGIRVRIIDKALEPGTASRALVVHARTLELYRQVGLADTIVDHGTKFGALNLWVRSRRLSRVVLGDMGKGLSPFPFMLILAQDRHERLLIERLRDAGVPVERGVELLDFQEEPGHIRTRLRDANGSEETCDSAYVAGCDGARSAVRDTLGAGFPGGTYQHLFYVADVEASGLAINHELHVDLADAEFLAVFPLEGERHARLIGIVREEAQGSAPASLTWSSLRPALVDRMGIQVDRVNWFSTYHVHHRVSSTFRRGRAFLLGDAAHIHSPVGGQGMNTGIGDAVNLAWKLADVLRGRADPELLDSYEPERIAFARRLVATTDRGFVVATSPGRVARFVRIYMVPRLLPLVVRLSAVRRFMFRTLSQIMIRYRDSTLSEGRAGQVHAGDRLPWIPLRDSGKADGDNFAELDGIHWQAQVYGDASTEIMATCRARGLALRVIPWEPAMTKARLLMGSLYLVRPDGYLAFVDPAPTAAKLEDYLDSRRLRMDKTTG